VIPAQMPQLPARYELSGRRLGPPHLWYSAPAPGKEWTNTGDVHEDRGL